MYEDLGFGVAMERVSGRFELVAKLLEVVDFAVEDNGDATVFIGHGLSAGLREIEDRKTTEAECNVAGDMLAAHVGTAVDDPVHH